MVWLRRSTERPGVMFAIPVMIADQTWQAWNGPRHQSREARSPTFSSSSPCPLDLFPEARNHEADPPSPVCATIFPRGPILWSRTMLSDSWLMRGRSEKSWVSGPPAPAFSAESHRNLAPKSAGDAPLAEPTGARA